MYDSYNVSERIKELAKLQRVPIKQLLENVGLGFNTMSNMKTSMPKADNLAKIADYLECSVDYLLGRTTNPAVNPDLPVVQPLRTVELYLLPASAGSGEFMDDDYTEKFEIPDTPENKKIDCAIRVSGDSMLPLIHDGDIALVSRRFDINDGDIGVFIVDGCGYIKKYRPDYLESVNPEFDNISIAGKSVLLVGKVLSFVQKQR